MLRLLRGPWNQRETLPAISFKPSYGFLSRVSSSQAKKEITWWWSFYRDVTIITAGKREHNISVSHTASWISPPPLQDTEIINTAILTGRTVAIPVKMVSIEMNGAVTDVSAFVQCKSSNEDILKVNAISLMSPCQLLPTHNPFIPYPRNQGSRLWLSFHSWWVKVMDRSAANNPLPGLTELSRHIFTAVSVGRETQGGNPGWESNVKVCRTVDETN